MSWNEQHIFQECFRTTLYKEFPGIDGPPRYMPSAGPGGRADVSVQQLDEKAIEMIHNRTNSLHYQDQEYFLFFLFFFFLS